MIKVIELEKHFLSQETRHSKRTLESLLSDDFLEVKNDGRTCDKKQFINELLDNKFDSHLIPSNFNGQTLSPSVIHLTYSLTEDTGLIKNESVRTSIWIKKDDRWTIHFHQSTNKV